jgi:hypothetical protein
MASTLAEAFQKALAREVDSSLMRLHREIVSKFGFADDPQAQSSACDSLQDPPARP